MRTYIVTIALSFIAGLLTAIFVYYRLFLAALLFLLILFTMIIFNEKTGLSRISSAGELGGDYVI